MGRMPIRLMAKMAMLHAGKKGASLFSAVSMIIQIVVMIGSRYP
jgi:hypothetical protein